MSPDIVIQQSLGGHDIVRIRELRYEILRKPHGMSLLSAVFPGDENESTIHVLALSESKPVGCASLFVDKSDAMQLRGMAVATDWQRRGIGHRIGETIKDIAISKGKTMWCNARFSAIGFYERQGWVKSGSFFDVPVIGQHIVMNWVGNVKNIG